MSWEVYQAAPEQIDSEAKAALRLTSIVGRAPDKLVVLARQGDASQAIIRDTPGAGLAYEQDSR